MKKLFTLLLALCLLPLCVMGEGWTVTAYDDGLKLTFTQPEGTFLLTQTSSAEDFAFCGLEREMALPGLVKNGYQAVLYWMEQPGDARTFIRAAAAPVSELNRQTGKALMEQVAASLKTEGYTIDEAVFVEDGINAVRFLYWRDLQDARLYIMEYNAVLNGRLVTVRTQVTGNAANEADLKTLEKLLATVKCETGAYQRPRTQETASGEVFIRLPEMTLRLSAVGNTVMMTRSSSASVFNRVGLFQSSTVSYMEEMDVYALIVPKGVVPTWQCSLSVWPDDEEGGNEEDDKEDDEDADKPVEERYREMYENSGYTVDEAVYCTLPQSDYVRLNCRYPNGDGTEIHMVMYGTTKMGYGIWIEMLSEKDPLTEEQLQMLAEIVDSIHYEPVQ